MMFRQGKTEEEPFQTTDADLAGFWDMVLLQVADVDRMFCELDELRRHEWNVKATDFVTVSISANRTDSYSLRLFTPWLMRNCQYMQWRWRRARAAAEGANHPGRQSRGAAKIWVIRKASDISRVTTLGVAKLQSSPGCQ